MIIFGLIEGVNRVRILKVEPGKRPKVAEISDTMKAMQEVVALYRRFTLLRSQSP